MNLPYYLVVFFCGIGFSTACAQYSLKGVVSNSENSPIANAEVFLENTSDLIKTNVKGYYEFTNLKSSEYTLSFYSEGFAPQTKQIRLSADSILDIRLDSIEVGIGTITITHEDNNLGMYRFRAVEGVAIFASKTAIAIDCKKVVGNLANNNSRQLYAKVSGLNIWENDNSGIQLNIGGRGLSPNRTSNFNTRQNGYDISADALGYPESYYSPPSQALSRIEVVRGAASLQYGTQFGGMLNFVLNDGPKDKLFEFTSENSYGSYNFVNTFNSIGGTIAKGKLSYYGYYQYKRGDGWRPNAGYNNHNGYLSLDIRPTDKLKISLEQTMMHYLAQQSGGLTDQEFRLDPRQSKRARNWFKVDWKLSSLTFDYKFSNKTLLNIRNFALFAGRESLGNLEPINRPDYGQARDLIKGRYQNFGNEMRILQRYSIAQRPSVLVVGTRLYKGRTVQGQGFSNADSTGLKTDFEFADPNGILKSDYLFPSFNFAAFAENYFAISNKFSITPGIRYEYIHTKATGYYQDLLVVQGTSGMDTLKNDKIYETRKSNRSVFLFGIGMSYKFTPEIELYTNFSQNYRAINFNDMRILNPNQEVNPNLKDERGFNADLGFKGCFKNLLNFDATFFYLSYRNRIGNLQGERNNADNPLIIEPYTLRTNIGDARVFGLETLVEADLWKMIKGTDAQVGLVVFANFSWLDGRYLNSENSFAAGKRLELVPPVTLRTGLSIHYKGFKASYQYSFTDKQYSDATNAELVPNAVVGIVPAYGVMDMTLGYEWKWFRLQASLSNMTDAKYFTRRATSYPGPGILPADGISFYTSLQVKLGVAKKKKKIVATSETAQK